MVINKAAHPSPPGYCIFKLSAVVDNQLRSSCESSIPMSQPVPPTSLPPTRQETAMSEALTGFENLSGLICHFSKIVHPICSKWMIAQFNSPFRKSSFPYFFLDKKPCRCHLTGNHSWQMNGVFRRIFGIFLIHIIKEEAYE